MTLPVIADDRALDMSVNPEPVLLGDDINFSCQGTGEWRRGLRDARIWIYDASNTLIVDEGSMSDSGNYLATYDFMLPANANIGQWSWICQLRDNRRHRMTEKQSFQVTEEISGGSSSGGSSGTGGVIAEHLTIESYDGPATCIACHEQEAHDALNSIHMQWSGPTPNLSNTYGEPLGKGDAGVNTFCTYAPSSKGACYGCHVRADGNAGHAPEVEDVDCLMCHNDTYQRKFVEDADNPLTVVKLAIFLNLLKVEPLKCPVIG